MSARVLVFSAVVIAAGVLALILVTSHRSGSSRKSGSASAAGESETGAAPGSRSAPRSTGRSAERIPTGPPPSRPELKVVETSADPGFAGEARDDDWAVETEAVIRERVEGLLETIRGSDAKAVGVARIECRTARCRLRVSGSDSKRFMQFVEALQGEDGFHGSASQLLLHGYAPAADSTGRASVTVVLVYDRDAP